MRARSSLSPPLVNTIDRNSARSNSIKKKYYLGLKRAKDEIICKNLYESASSCTSVSQASIPIKKPFEKNRNSIEDLVEKCSQIMVECETLSPNDSKIETIEKDMKHKVNAIERVMYEIDMQYSPDDDLILLNDVERFNRLDRANNEENLQISLDNPMIANFSVESLQRQRKKMFEKHHKL